MKKTLLTVLVVLSILMILIRFKGEVWNELFKNQNRAGIKILSEPSSVVYFSGKEMGKTPYQDENIPAGEYEVTLKTTEATWSGLVTVEPGTMSIVNREIYPSLSASSGETLSLEKGRGVTVLSEPIQAEIEIDGQVVGETPQVIKDLKSGEHVFVLSHSGYLKRSLRATLPEGMNLVLKVDLALSEPTLTSNIPVVSPQTAGLTSLKLIVKNTPTGYLRVREKPTLTALEVAKVYPGDSLIKIGEQPGWYKVRLNSGKEGYISSVYAKEAS